MSDFKQRLRESSVKGEFAYAYAKLVVHGHAKDFADVVSKPDFDMDIAWDDDVVLNHIDHQRKRSI